MIKRAYLAKWLRLRVLFPFLSMLPMSLGYRVAARIGRFDARGNPARAPMTEGLLTLFPDLSEDRARLDSILDRHFEMMARDTLDCFLMPGFTPRRTGDLIKVAGIEHLAAAKRAGTGVILIISHFGRFFMLGPGLRFSGHEFGMLTTAVDERNPHYDAIDRWHIATKLRNTQMFSRGTWITTSDDIRKTYRALKSGEVVLIALDGNETRSTTRYEFPFMNGVLSLPEGIVRIASATKARMVYGSVLERAHGVEIRIHALPDDPLSGLGEAVRILERELRAQPWHWWQWAAYGQFWRPNATH